MRFLPLSSIGVLVLLGAVLAPASPPTATPPALQRGDYTAVRDRAELYYDEGSYRIAHQAYTELATLELTAQQQRWVEFRLADTSWRAQAGTNTSDTTTYDRSRQQLEALIAGSGREEDRDSVWAEVQESLGDFWWTRRDARNWSAAWLHYQQALEWWAASHEIDTARDRYIGIVWKVADPPESDRYYHYGYYGNVLPLEIVDNVSRIAATDGDRARAHFLAARTLQQQGGSWDAWRRIPEEFEAALEAGTDTAWRDDALYHYAEWLASNGRVVRGGDTPWRFEPDYLRALELYRQIVSEFRRGGSRYFD